MVRASFRQPPRRCESVRRMPRIFTHGAGNRIGGVLARSDPHGTHSAGRARAGAPPRCFTATQLQIAEPWLPGEPASSELIPDTVQSLASVKKPTLILHAAEDACVAFSEAERLRAGISAPCNLIALDNMTHQLESRQGRRLCGGFDPCVAVRYRPETALVRGLPSDVSRGQVRVLEANHAFLRDIRTDHHARRRADEPLSAGAVIRDRIPMNSC